MLKFWLMTVILWVARLWHPNGDVNIKDLSRRKFVLGAQAVFAFWVLCQPFIMFFTHNTAIARIRIDYGVIADVFGVTVVISAVALITDVYFSMMDLHDGNALTTTPIGQALARWRHWFYFSCSFWALCLMTTVKAENGLGAIIAYAMYFVVQATIGTGLAIRDGCITNRQQKQDYLHSLSTRTESEGCGYAL